MSWCRRVLHGRYPNPGSVPVGTSMSSFRSCPLEPLTQCGTQAPQAVPQGHLHGHTSSPLPCGLPLPWKDRPLGHTPIRRAVLIGLSTVSTQLVGNSILMFKTLVVGAMPTSAPHSASLSPLAFTRLPATNCQWVQVTFSKEFSHHDHFCRSSGRS